MAQKFSRLIVYNTLTPYFLYASEILTLRKKEYKTIDINPDAIFRITARYTLFDEERNEEILEEMKVERVDEKRRRCKIKLATTCSKNEQQQNGEN